MHELGLVLNVCYRHLADINADAQHVRFWGKADMPDPRADVRQ